MFVLLGLCVVYTHTHTQAHQWMITIDNQGNNNDDDDDLDMVTEMYKKKSNRKCTARKKQKFIVFSLRFTPLPVQICVLQTEKKISGNGDDL